jgi:hypothetical protein
MMNQNEQRVVWGDSGWADSSGWERAHCTDTITGEYTGQQDVWVSAGTSLPAGAYLDQPPEKEPGKAIVRNGDSWIFTVDNRGKKAYEKQTGIASIIVNLGELPSDLTLIPPSSQFDVWDEHSGTWVRDQKAEQQAALAIAQQEQSLRLTTASQQIAILKPAVDGNYAKPEHTQLLADWQRYRYELTRVPEQSGWPESPQWPDQPETII